MAKAKVFMSGGSQAIRLPAEYRFDCDEVEIHREPQTGNLVIAKPRKNWDDYFAWLDTIEPSPDFLLNRHQPMDEFRSPFEPKRAGSPPAERKRAVAQRRQSKT